MKGLKGRAAIVTGGSSGIGQAIAIRLGEESTWRSTTSADLKVLRCTS